MFLDRSDDLARRLGVLGRNGGEIETQDSVRLEEHGETLRIGDRPIDRAALKPRERGREIQIVGQCATEWLEPPLVECATCRFALGHL